MSICEALWQSNQKTSRHGLNPLNTVRVLSVGRAQGAGVSETYLCNKEAKISMEEKYIQGIF